MLKVQEYLKNNSLEELKSELNIKVSENEKDNLIILNYCQIKSPKTEQIVRECRGLVLDYDYNLVAKSFNRFFNWGEVIEESKNFDFSKFISQSKEDGSLIIIYNHNDKWFINTRSSFGYGTINFTNKTWEEMVLGCLNVKSKEELSSILDKGQTYICELCTTYNKVVRLYSEPKLYLLTVFEKYREYNFHELGSIYEINIFSKPEFFSFSSIEDIKQYLDERSIKDPTFEGVVIRDIKNNRWKIKSSTYFSLHKIKNNNGFNPTSFIPFILNNDDSEILSYFPEIKEDYMKYKEIINNEYNNLKKLFLETKEIEDQKEFALAVKDNTKYYSILFKLKKELGNNSNIDNLNTIWRQSQNLIEKNSIKGR